MDSFPFCGPRVALLSLLLCPWLRLRSDPWGAHLFRTTAEIEADDPTYEKFASDLLARVSVDDLKAAGFDTNFAADGDTKNFKDRLQIWLTESNTIAIESYDRTPFNETVTQVCLAKQFSGRDARRTSARSCASNSCECVCKRRRGRGPGYCRDGNETVRSAIAGDH